MAPYLTTTPQEVFMNTVPVNDDKELKEHPTFEEIKKAVPPHCFKKSITKSIYYLLQDYAIIACLYYILPHVETFAGWPGLLLWYWITGLSMTSLYVVGHDCVHGCFSDYEWLNDICGHMAYSPILTSYYGFRKYHRLHHLYTSHLEKDLNHPWVTEEEHQKKSWFERIFAKFPIEGLWRWSLLFVATHPFRAYFSPFSNLYSNIFERIQCLFSGLLCVCCAYTAYTLFDYNLYNFFKYYYIPVAVHTFWMVMITWLQHRDEEIQVYEEGNWNFVKGMAETIDREYGFGIDKMVHHMTDGHVAHHYFFNSMPHYHLPEATQAIRKVLEPYNMYKFQKSYDFLIEFCILYFKLEYLVGKGTGLLMYNASSRNKIPEQKKSQEKIINNKVA